MLSALIALTPAAPLQDVEWDRDVRPILSQHCFQCHGPDEAARQARLRLDLPEVKDDPRGILGDLEHSALFARISATDADEVMPPPEIGKDLSAAQVEVLRRWIEQGAAYGGHWSFAPVPTPEVPAVDARFGEVSPIDAFVLARLKQAGLEPSAEADRRTLIRRVSFDLTGEPPTPAQVEAYVGDERPDAYEQLVDRLLASDAYGERMALAWMDAARYGDTSVYHADGPRQMWPWRDWVIRAYNANLPFDDFTTWQLAGDLLPDATLDQRVASGFHRNNGTSDEGGAIDEELRVSYIVDRVATTGNVWLGLSLECAQCHDHKYDPVPQEDYYGFYAFFNQANEKGFQTRNGNAPPFLAVPTGKQQVQLDELASQIEELTSALAEAEVPAAELADWSAKERAALLAERLPALGPWSSMGPFGAANSKAAFNETFGPETGPDPSAFAGGDGKVWVAQPAYEDGKPHTLGSTPNAATYLYRTLEASEASTQTISLGSDDTLSVWLNGEQLLHKEVYRGTQPDQEKVELNLAQGTNHLLLKVVNGGGPSGFYFKLLGTRLPDPVAAALRATPEERDDAARGVLSAYYKVEVWPVGKALNTDLAAVTGRKAELEGQIPTSMMLQDAPTMRQTYVLNRGQYDGPDMSRPVEPRVLEQLLPMPAGAPANRLGLARWLTHPEHPLTARVAVNRYWSMLFGEGLVGTVMDFGSQGEYPSHPQLLDWLARDFVAHGWDVKRSLRQIVTSRTYRQSSRQPSALAEVDPTNELLARAARFRLQGEFIRDGALAAAGLLVDEVGGPGVKPYQPPGLWNAVSLDGGLRFTRDNGEKLYRKSMYIFWKRSAPMPAMTIFDAPTREKCVVQRQRTNTPLQALVVMNDEQFVEAARHLAERMLAAGDSFEEHLDAGFLLCTARPADQLRRDVVLGVYRDALAQYQADPASAKALLGVGESGRDETLDSAEHAAWTVVASLLLNLDETLTRD